MTRRLAKRSLFEGEKWACFLGRTTRWAKELWVGTRGCSTVVATGMPRSQPFLPEVTRAKSAETGFRLASHQLTQMQVALVAWCRDEASTVVRNSATGLDASRIHNR